MQVEHILSRLDSVRQSRKGWTARCPAHHDRIPSLSVREGERGVLLHCWAGCTVKEICAALGLDLKDLFPSSEGAPHRIRLAQQSRQRRDQIQQGACRFGGLRNDLLREAESVIRNSSPIVVSALPPEQLDRFIDAIGGAHHVIRREQGEQAYAEWSSCLGKNPHAVGVSAG